MTFWQSIKTNFNNGNIGKWTAAIGKATFTAGLTGAIIHDMNKGGGSIFGGCCGNSGFMMGGGCFGGGMMNPMYNPMANPMGIGVFGGTNMYQNAMNTQYGNQLAYNWGYQLGQQARFEAAQKQQLSNFKATTADAISKDQSTEKGKAFDKATDEMVDKDGKAVDGKEYVIANINNEKTKASDYRSAVTELGKSFGADMDKSKDGYVNLEEFTEHAMSKLPENATDEQKQKAKAMAEIAFKKMDLTKDGKADWKELAATIATFDTDYENVNDKLNMDGKIDSKDYEAWTKAMNNSTDQLFSNSLKINYTNLFKQ